MKKRLAGVALAAALLANFLTAEPDDPNAWQALLDREPEAESRVSALERAVLEALTPEQHADFADGKDPRDIVLDAGGTLADLIERELDKGSVASGLVYLLPRAVVHGAQGPPERRHRSVGGAGRRSLLPGRLG